MSGGGGYDISLALSNSEAQSQDSHAVYNVGGGIRPAVAIVLAAVALVVLVAWLKVRKK